jgi:signal transduction histidine kinase
LTYPPKDKQAITEQINTMTEPKETTMQVEPLDSELGDLEIVLAAWQSATDRLQHTHEALRNEVRRLTDELEIKNRQLARKNRLADLGQMASHVAHEVRNSLVPITLYLSLLRRHLHGQAACLHILDKMEAGFTALEVTVHDLLQFTSDRDPCLKLVDIHALVHDICDSLAPQLEAQGIQTELDIPVGLRIVADGEMLRRATMNLVLNALDAMPDGGELSITAWMGARTFELEIADSGPGINDNVRRHLFEPFFTTKSNGTGLGLTIVDRIAEAHGGEVRAENCPQGGAAFTIQIPFRSMEAAA